jgi:hypothetical protein
MFCIVIQEEKRGEVADFSPTPLAKLDPQNFLTAKSKKVSFKSLKN